MHDVLGNFVLEFWLIFFSTFLTLSRVFQGNSPKYGGAWASQFKMEWKCLLCRSQMDICFLEITIEWIFGCTHTQTTKSGRKRRKEYWKSHDVIQLLDDLFLIGNWNQMNLDDWPPHSISYSCSYNSRISPNGLTDWRDNSNWVSIGWPLNMHNQMCKRKSRMQNDNDSNQFECR